MGLGTAVGYRSRLCIGFCFHLANSDETFPQDYDIHMLGDRFCCNRYNYCAEMIAFLSLIFSFYRSFAFWPKGFYRNQPKFISLLSRVSMMCPAFPIRSCISTLVKMGLWMISEIQLLKLSGYKKFFITF
jgi:hypothetical protein